MRPFRADDLVPSSRGTSMAGASQTPRTPPPKLSLVSPADATESSGHTALELWHLLSLDAPCVAATWTFFIAWASGVRLSILDPVAMFLAVWMLYAADRLLDARSLFVDAEAPDLEERHRFHHRHRRLFLPGLVGATLPLVWLLHSLNSAVLHLYTLLAVLLAGWLLLVHARDAPGALERRLPKEVAVGIFFGAAVFIATVARAPALRLVLFPDVLLFGGLCALNCLLLYSWEHPYDRSRAHASTRYATGHLRPLAGLLVTASVCLVIWGFSLSHGHETSPTKLLHPTAIPACCALSLGLLLWLGRNRRHIPPTTVRALADLVLLTPLIPLAAFAMGLLP